MIYDTTPAPLIRAVTRTDFITLIINITIGAGIMGLPAQTYALLGPYSVWAFAGCAVLVMALMLCFAEVGSRFKGTGGPYLYALTAFGPFTGFLSGWLLWLSRLFSFASVCNLLVDYVAALYPEAGGGIGRILLMLVMITLLALVNYRGIRTATTVNNVITVCKLTVLVLFVAVGFFFVHPQTALPVKAVSAAPFAQSVLLLLFAFSGFDVAVVPSGEIRDPQKNVPFGMFTALVVVTVLYMGIQYVCIGTLPSLATSSRPLAQSAYTFMGQAGVYVVTAGGVVTMLGTLSVLMLTSSRLLYAMAEQGQLPGQLAFIHPKYHTPSLSVIVTAVLLAVLSCSGSFIHALTISAIIRLFTLITTCLALPVLRRRGKESPPFRVRFGIPIAIFAVLMCLILLWHISGQEAQNAVLLAGAGAAIYGGWYYYQKRRSFSGLHK